jgi:uncharacterized caspase-like protein
VAAASADISARPLSYVAVVANKIYDGSTAATISSESLSGVVAGDSVSTSHGSASFADKEIGYRKTVTIAGVAISGADSGNYSIAPVATAQADIAVAGGTALSGTTETMLSQQSSLQSLAVAPIVQGATEPAGGIGNGGATMSNFQNGATPSQPVADAAHTEAPAQPTAAKLVVDANKSLPKLAGVLNRSDLQAIGRQVYEARTQLFGEALSLLAKNPRAADIADCGAGGGDLCIVAASPQKVPVQDEYLPMVKRKVALLIGNNNYRSPITELDTAINDVTVIGAELKEKMGYEVKVIRNADRRGIVDALNDLIRNTERNDSVVVMYAGHGYLQDSTKMGYWLPTDADAEKPDNWISNDTIARALGNIPAKQVMLVSDSCYSGTLTKEGKVAEIVGISREQTLTRRSVLALSSGADEPVSDEGRENHSIFAWNMIQSIKQMKDETSGQKLHAVIKEAVTREFPQVPQYGAVISAGHAAGGEYLLMPKKEEKKQ